MTDKILEVQFDQTELALRLLEVGCEMKRPPGKSAKDAMAEIEMVEPDLATSFKLMAVTALLYITEVINDDGRVSNVN